ncbi:MAG: molybdenum cofactor sulfurase [Cyclobacteriaceae bacterium]|nr:MAG: molybdenum cofactor sulfurase [Cyclobacteriaceae bacterium]
MIASVKSIWRFPVKSFHGERLDKAELTSSGIFGDRAYGLIDTETGKVVSAKSVKLFPDLLECSASYNNPPLLGQELPSILITLPNGTKVSSNSSDVNQVLSDFFGRNVTLAKNAPIDYTIDQYHPDLENLDPSGHRDTSVEQKAGAALFKSMGIDSPIPDESFMDVFPLSLITTSTLEEMTRISPETNFDPRRFRMNLVVQTEQLGFLENTWVGKTISIGEHVNIMVTMPDPRCVMTTLAQGEIPKDSNVLRTLVKHNRLDVMGAGRYPCAGVYAVAGNGGTISIDDTVEVR